MQSLPFATPIRDIERTPEYESFMRKLEEFHSRKGYVNIIIITRMMKYNINIFIDDYNDFNFITLHRTEQGYTKEPLLGGMRVDLLKLGVLVKAMGGFQRVTADRSWKRVADYFDFPPTCTNAAFVLKKIYVQSLKDFLQQNDPNASAVVGNNNPANYIKKLHDETSSDEELKKAYAQTRKPGKQTAIPSLCYFDIASG